MMAVLCECVRIAVVFLQIPKPPTGYQQIPRRICLFTSFLFSPHWQNANVKTANKQKKSKEAAMLKLLPTVTERDFTRP